MKAKSTATKKVSAPKSIDEIFANAQATQAVRRERARDVNNRDEAEIERLSTSDITQGQIEALRKMGEALGGRTFDERAIRDGGSLNRLTAGELMDEWGAELRARREALRAGPATEGQLNALVRFGCEPKDIRKLTFGDASDLLNKFIKNVQERKAGKKG